MSQHHHGEISGILENVSFSGEKETSKVHKLLTFPLGGKNFDLCISLIKPVLSVQEGSPINISDIELKIYPENQPNRLAWCYICLHFAYARKRAQRN